MSHQVCLPTSEPNDAALLAFMQEHSITRESIGSDGMLENFYYRADEVQTLVAMILNFFDELRRLAPVGR